MCKDELGNNKLALYSSHKNMSLVLRKGTRAIVPYVNYRYAPYIRAANLAYRAGNMAYRNRRGISRAARTIQRAFRNRRRKRRRRNPNVGNTRAVRQRIGEKVGHSTAKLNSGPQLTKNSASSNVLHNVLINDIPKATNSVGDGNSITARQRDIVNYRGFKFCMEYKNIYYNEVNGQLVKPPLYFNYAFVIDKRETADQTTINGTDFFRNDGAGSTRSVDFGKLFPGITYHCLPINTDRFSILYRRRMILNATDGNEDFNSNFGSNYGYVEKYVKINRQLQFDTGGQLPVNGKIFFVYWCAPYGSGSSVTNEQPAIQLSYNFVNYFKEPKN